jgi:predicted ester cyclase
MSTDRLNEVPASAISSLRAEEENKEVVDRWLTSFWGTNYDPAIVDEIAAREIFFSYSLHLPQSGPFSVMRFMKEIREAFPDFTLERTADLVAAGDVVMFRWVCAGTHTGPAFYDLPMGSLPHASGRTMRFSGMSAIRLKAGKITEEIGLADGVAALNQLGFIRIPPWPS